MIGSKNQVLWHLDSEVDDRTFERVCVDLLYRNGYHDIDPYGGKRDHGRDAEVRRRRHILVSPTGERTFFQFSLADRWEGKLQEELNKIRDYGHEIDAFLFVTTAAVTGHKRDVLRDRVRQEYGWELDIKEREWLRLQLEVAHPDIAEKHLGIAPVGKPGGFSADAKPPVTANTVARTLYDAGEYEGATLPFKRYLQTNSCDASAWRALAWCQYVQQHYADALASINRAAKLQPHDLYTQRVSGCILVEKGIQDQERASIVRGKTIFADVARTSETWTDHYNLGNALTALGEHAAARDAYITAVGIVATQPMIWKNLGAAHMRLDNHDEALVCYENALKLNPDLPEALIAKGIHLITRGGDPLAGVELIERVLDRDETARVYWATAWYWAAEGYHRSDRPVDALRVLGEGLAHIPNHDGLLNLKAHILSGAWKDDPALQREAETFFAYRPEVAPNDFRPVEWLGRIYIATDRAEQMWSALDRFFDSPSAAANLRKIITPSVDLLVALRHVRIYKRFREQKSVDDYVQLFAVAGRPLTDAEQEALYWVFAESFGLAFQELYDAEPRDEGTLSTAFENQLGRLRSVIARWVSHVATAPKDRSPESLIETMTALIIGCGKTVLLESSRTVGFLAGFFAIDTETMTLPAGLSTLESDVAIDVMRAANEQMGLFPDR
jgi:tetratricopeptide (TPR) repeat protein